MASELTGIMATADVRTACTRPAIALSCCC